MRLSSHLHPEARTRQVFILDRPWLNWLFWSGGAPRLYGLSLDVILRLIWNQSPFGPSHQLQCRPGWKMRRGYWGFGRPPVRPAWPSPLIQHHLVERTGNSHISLPTGTVGHYTGWIPISWTEGLRLNTEALDTGTYSQALCYILLSHS